jgi:ankyrin repeat protein
MLRAAVIKGDLEEARKHAHEDPCEPNAEDSGLTCHHYAAQYNCLPVLLFLRELPGQRERQLHVRSKRGYTVLHSAALAGSVECLAELLQDASREAVNARNEWGETALHLAAQAGSARCYELLRQSGMADEGACDQWGRTAATVAAECFLGRQEAIRKPEEPTTRPKMQSLSRLIEYPLDDGRFAELCDSPEMDVRGADAFGLTALHKLSAWDKAECAAALLRLAPELIDRRDAEGRTAAHHAASQRVWELLRDSGADLTLCDKRGRLPELE